MQCVCCTYRLQCIVVPTQVEKMRAELASLNPCAVPFLSRTTVNLSWNEYTTYIKHIYFVHTFYIYQSITDYLYFTMWFPYIVHKKYLYIYARANCASSS